MRKFFPSFVLVFLLAVSFLVPVHYVSAEVKANISLVTAMQKLTHNYAYTVCPGEKIASAQPSFFTRLLAAIGITRSLPAEKLAKGSVDCDVRGITSQVSDSFWSCIPKIFNAKSGNSFSCSNENSNRSDKIIFSQKYVDTYGITSCTTTHTYADSVGTITTMCLGSKAQPPSTTKVTYPPTVDVNGNGFYTGRSMVSAIKQDSFYVKELYQTMLNIFPARFPASGADLGSTYSVPISVMLTQAVFNNKTTVNYETPFP